MLRLEQREHRGHKAQPDRQSNFCGQAGSACGVKLPFVRIEHKLAAKNGDCSRLFISAISCCDRMRFFV